VVDHPALSIDPADPRAGVHAVQVDTGQGGRAVRVNGALRSACYVGVAEVLRNALACSGSVPARASSVAPAGGGVAGIYDLRGC
jgi:hypothetical protein